MTNRNRNRDLIPFTAVPVRHRRDGWTVEKQYAFIETLAENEPSRPCRGQGGAGHVVEDCRAQPVWGQASTTMAGASARTRMGSLRLLRFDLLPRARARARVPLPTLATFVPRKSRRHREHSRRLEMWSRACSR